MKSSDEIPAVEQARDRMVEQIRETGISNPAVLAAMRDVPRHEFVPPDVVASAYGDHPLSIGHGQTISQPYIVALMTALANPQPTDVALEIGTGSGYQAAVLARLVKHLYTVERVEALAEQARQRLQALDYDNVDTRVGDGAVGWPEAAPFDVILVTAAPDRLPQPLLDQLAAGGRLVSPVGPSGAQDLILVEKDQAGQTRTTRVMPVRFVEMR